MASTWTPDATTLAVFRQCPELYRLRFGLNLRPPAEPKRDGGSALHVALDTWFRKPVSDERAALAALRQALEPDASVVGVLAPNTQARGLPHLERVVQEYARVYPREKDTFTVTANEAYVEGVIGVGWGGKQPTPDGPCPLCGGRLTSWYCAKCDSLGLPPSSFAYCGIIDRKVRMPDGSEYIVDVKSTGAYASEPYRELASVSDQMVGYVALERAAGRRCDGFYIDHIHIDDRYLKVASEHFQRLGPYMVPEWRVQRWAEDVLWTLQDIERLKAARGLDKPWPVYHNWAYGKPDAAFWQFIKQPEELHASLRLQFEEEAWRPAEVAEQRRLVRLTAKLNE